MKDRDVFDLQNIKRVGQSFYILTVFYSFILLDNVVNYLSFVIIYGNLLK